MGCSHFVIPILLFNLTMVIEYFTAHPPMYIRTLRLNSHLKHVHIKYDRFMSDDE